MGAHDFEAIAEGKTIKEAYENAVADAQHEYGHNPYSGTIATTDGFFEIGFEYEGESATRAELRELFDRIFDDPRTQKWGLCGGAKVSEDEYYFAGWAAC